MSANLSPLASTARSGSLSTLLAFRAVTLPTLERRQASTGWSGQRACRLPGICFRYL